MRSRAPGTIYYTTDGTDPRLPELPGFEVELVAEGVAARGLVPTPANGGPELGDTWKGGQEPFDDSSWTAGATGIGFGYPDLTGIDASAMVGVTGSAYLRVPFAVEAATLDSLAGLSLNLKYEDGFVAWINGVEVTSSNRPAALTWNSTATATHRDLFAVDFVAFDITEHLDALNAGDNLLALQVMNSAIDNNDLLALPQLVGRTAATEGPSPSARRYDGPLLLETATTIIARLEQNGTWSGPVTASYLIDTVPAGEANLVISEVMYRPPDANPSEERAGYADRDEFEYLELMNISATDTIDLTGVQLAQVDHGGDLQGIEFTFSPSGPLTFLPPGQRLVLVENIEAFRRRYGPGPRIAGQYRNALSNDGERVTLLDVTGNPIRAFTYNDQLPWPPAADGDGYSLVLQSAGSNPDHDLALNWIPSASVHGTPGSHDALPFTGIPESDHDRDGLPALVEHALGSHDQDPASGPGRFAITRQGPRLFLTHTRNLRSQDTRIAIETSGNLSTWRSDPGDGSVLLLTDRVHNGDGTETLVWRMAPGVDSLFFRLRVSLLP